MAAVLASMAACAVPAPSASPVAQATGAATPSSSKATPIPSVQATIPPIAVQRLKSSRTVGAFNLASLGSAILWSSGPIDSNTAPDLWRLEVSPGSGASPTQIYRSHDAQATIANPSSNGTEYAFVETSQSTWQLVVLDDQGKRSVIDEYDLGPGARGLIPAPAFGTDFIIWSTTHSDGTHPSQTDIEKNRSVGMNCQIRIATLPSLNTTTLASSPCKETEYWYVSAEGPGVAYSTVEYGPDGTHDDRHVYLIDRVGASTPRQLDTTGEAAMPFLLGGTVVWKTAVRSLNMNADGNLEIHSISDGTTRPVPTLDHQNFDWGPPSMGPRFIASQFEGGWQEYVFDRTSGEEVLVDSVAPTGVVPRGDPGFLSEVRLAGSLLTWFYTPSTLGGSRELRWALLPG